MLHTSDWHIGRRFRGLDLLDLQAKALDWLIDTIQQEHVDVLCVGGDIYDLPFPSAKAVELFSTVFERLGSLQVNGHPLQIVMVPGNHDSAARLGVGSDLLRSNIHMRCNVAAIADPVDIRINNEHLLVYAVPFLDPDTSRQTLEQLTGHAVASSHADAMRAALELIEANLQQQRQADPHVAATMLVPAYVSGTHQVDSERGICVGGVDSVPASLFSDSQLDYIALGHLHTAQQVTIPVVAADQRPPIAQYSGAILAYSFSEATVPPRRGNGKQVMLVDFDTHDAATPCTVQAVDVQSDQPALVSLTDTVQNLISKEAPLHRDDWVSLTLETKGPIQRREYQQLGEAFHHILEKRVVYMDSKREYKRVVPEVATYADELGILESFVQYSYGRAATDAELKVLRTAVERVHAKQAASDEQ
ncbi:metallophosphoesterase family protein [Bifidobacterium dolichotidis]|nr:exonuclease SbcCD subunit D [Bifidobacterium dolichotidis]